MKGWAKKMIWFSIIETFTLLEYGLQMYFKGSFDLNLPVALTWVLIMVLPLFFLNDDIHKRSKR